MSTPKGKSVEDEIKDKAWEEVQKTVSVVELEAKNVTRPLSSLSRDYKVEKVCLFFWF
jgi:hypothetical protein